MGGVISRGLALLTSIFVARILGMEGFGELGIIQSTILMMGIVASFGTGTTATKYIAQYRHSDPEKVGRILGISTILTCLFGVTTSLILAVCAPLIATQVIAAPHLSSMLRAGSIYLLLSSINGIQIGVLAGFEDFKTLSKLNLVSGVVSCLSIGASVYLFGLEGAVWAYNISALLSCVLYQYIVRKVMIDEGINWDYRNCLKEVNVIWTYSLPLMLTNSLVGPVFWACNVMLVNQKNGYAEMGVYNAAMQWKQLTLILPSLIAQAALPVMASSNLRTFSSRQIKLNFRINIAVTLPILVLLCFMSPVIMGSYGNSFSSSWAVFVIVQCATFFQVLQSPIVTYWAASGRMWTNFTLNAVWGFSLVLLSWLFIEKGALGLSFALFVSFMIFGIILLVVSARTTDVAG